MSKQSKESIDRDSRIYILDKIVIDFHLRLHSYKDKNVRHFHDEVDVSLFATTTEQETEDLFDE